MTVNASVDLQRLIDIEDIRQLKAKFGLLADALCAGSDPALAIQFGALFTENATIDSAAFGHYEGREQIQNLFSQAVPSQMKAMWHSFQNPLIEVDGDRARAQWTMIAYTYAANAATEPATLTFGRYRDEYVRTDAGWQQSKLYFETSALDSQALAQAARGTRSEMQETRSS